LKNSKIGRNAHQKDIVFLNSMRNRTLDKN